MNQSPFHQEDTRHQPMSNQHTDAREVLFAELPPQALVEATDSIIRIRRTLAVGDTVKEVTVISAFLPHSFHLGTAWLKVAKVLFAKARLFVNGDGMSWEGTWGRVIGGQSA